MQKEIPQLATNLRRIEAAENSGDAAALVELLADDVVLMVPNQPIQQGKPACAEFIGGVMADQRAHFDRRIAYVSEEHQAFGGWAFDRGRFSFSIAPKTGGETSHEHGKYLFLYSRTVEGDWKIARAIVNLDDREDNAPIRLRSAAPVFLVSDVNDTAAWYELNLGFEVAGVFPPQPPASWASLQRDGVEIMLQRLAGYEKPDVYERRRGGVWNAYLRMRGVRALYETVRDKPFIKMPLKKQPYGDWEFEVVDPDGYVLVFGGDETLD